MTHSSAPNATAAKFGYPATLIAEYRHWVVLVRPHQCTLGALVLICTDEAEAFSALAPAAYGELQPVTGDIERALTAFRAYERINYLMLMMNDKDVHFHVLPRYGREQEFEGATYRDTGWPGVPDLAAGLSPDPEQLVKLTEVLTGAWSPNTN